MRVPNATTALWRWVRPWWMPGRSIRRRAERNGHLVSDSNSMPADLSHVQANGAAALALPGRLIIVEGIDGSGKSTQLDLLRKWLVNLGYLVIFSEWNSSPIVKG